MLLQWSTIERNGAFKGAKFGYKFEFGNLNMTLNVKNL